MDTLTPCAIGQTPIVRQLRRLLGNLDAVGLFDANGESVWLDGHAETLTVPLALQANARTAMAFMDGQHTRAAVNLFDSSDRHLGTLRICIPCQADSAADGNAMVCPALECAAEFAVAEYERNQELDAIAIELTERYEELNLLYDTDNQLDTVDEGRQALEKLMRNCVGYLALDRAVLIMPDRDLTCANNANGLEVSSAFIDLLSGNVLSWIQKTKTAVVINDADDPLRDSLYKGRAGKLVAVPVFDHADAIGGVLAVTKGTDRENFHNSDRNALKVIAKKIAKIIQANYDPLTGLMMRDSFETRLTTAIAESRQSASEHSLVVINLDQLRVINDMLGHGEGDRVLKEVAHILRQRLRGTDAIARLGGDEFGIMLHNCPLATCGQMAERLRQAINSIVIDSDTGHFNVSASFGVTALDRTTENVVTAFGEAETACGLAKELGRDRIRIYQSEDSVLIRRTEDLQWVGRIQAALKENRFTLFSQIIQPLQVDSLSAHFEVLVRMIDESGKILPPGMFMPAAERYKLMAAVDRWVIAETLSQLAAIGSANIAGLGLCAINLSGQSIGDPDFVGFVIEQIESSSIPPSKLCFELTETAAIANLETADAFMRQLRACGCVLALDDFGSGLSSFAYLKQLPVDLLKIDGSFVKDLLDDPISEAMVRAIDQVGKTMALQTVAEFVENDAIRERLRSLGIDYGQGYGIAKPRPLTEQLDEISASVCLAAS